MGIRIQKIGTFSHQVSLIREKTESHMGRCVKSINFKKPKHATIFAVFSEALRGIAPKQTEYANISYVTYKICKFHVKKNFKNTDHRGEVRALG